MHHTTCGLCAVGPQKTDPAAWRARGADMHMYTCTHMEIQIAQERPARKRTGTAGYVLAFIQIIAIAQIYNTFLDRHTPHGPG